MPESKTAAQGQVPDDKLTLTSANSSDIAASQARRAIGPVSACDPGYEKWDAEIKPNL